MTDELIVPAGGLPVDCRSLSSLKVSPLILR
jgi:hypothetical protein